MKLIGFLLAGLLSLYPIKNQANQTANATIFCYSPRFQRGLDPGGNYYLNLTSLPGTLNGELALDFLDSGYTHSAYLSLVDELLGETLAGQLALDVPDGGDRNHDGFPDFFQTFQGITNIVSTGAYHLDVYGNGSATATWNRNAGSKDGSCALTIKLMPFQPVTFVIPFEILEYKGSLKYSPTSTNVAGTVDLAQTSNSGALMNGQLALLKTLSDPFNQLILQPGAWTNESHQIMSYLSHIFTREETWPTNYYGFLEFDDDNNPTTLFPYAVWMLSIDDLNDSDRDTIPDFSDDPVVKPFPRKPQLELVQIGTNVLIKIHGDIGSLHEIQRVPDLAFPHWQSVVSLTLTSDPQTVSIPLPPERASFWRIKAQ